MGFCIPGNPNQPGQLFEPIITWLRCVSGEGVRTMIVHDRRETSKARRGSRIVPYLAARSNESSMAPRLKRGLTMGPCCQEGGFLQRNLCQGTCTWKPAENPPEGPVDDLRLGAHSSLLQVNSSLASTASRLSILSVPLCPDDCASHVKIPR